MFDFFDRFLAWSDNFVFWTAFFAWTTAQCIKMLFSFLHTRKLDLRYLVSTGGMPSAHSATVCALSTAIGLEKGFDSATFALASVFAIITMFDASTVRYAAGQQAKVVNLLADSHFADKYPLPKRLKELLGHTRPQVYMGMFTGIIFAILSYYVFFPETGLRRMCPAPAAQSAESQPGANTNAAP